MLHDLSAALAVGGDDRLAHGQRFEQYPRDSFTEVRRKHDDVGDTQDLANVLAKVRDDAKIGRLCLPQEVWRNRIRVLSLVRTDQKESRARTLGPQPSRRCNKLP